MTLTPPREQTLAKVVHPDVLRTPGGEVHLIADPLADRIATGDPTFGWEGDDRFALYVNLALGRWELWRLEVDNIHRLSTIVPGHVKGNDAVAWVIRWIVDHDSRRGFNAVDFVLAENIRTQKEQDAAASVRNEEAADRLHFGLLKDTGHIEAGVTRRQY